MTAHMQHSLDQPTMTNRSNTTAVERRAGMFSRPYLMADIDPVKSTWPMTAYCFMSGFIDAICFSATFIWCGFQTGNTAQLAIAICRLFAPSPDRHFYIADRQALTSLLCFLFGALLGRTGDRVGAKTRAWLCAGTFLQALLTAAAALCIWQSGQNSIGSDRGAPAWTNALSFVCVGLVSASLGLQGVMGKRVDTQFSATVVLTTTWCELMADRDLFRVRRLALARDHKILCVVGLTLGAFTARALLEYISDAGTLAIGAAARVLIAGAWLFVPAQAPSPCALEEKPPGSTTV